MNRISTERDIRLRDPISWLTLATWGSSRNLIIFCKLTTNQYPKILPSHDVEECEDDCCEDEDAESEVCQHEERDEGDAGEGQAQVARQLVRDHSVRLPCGVDLGNNEALSYGRKANGRFYSAQVKR